MSDPLRADNGLAADGPSPRRQSAAKAYVVLYALSALALVGVGMTGGAGTNRSAPTSTAAPAPKIETVEGVNWRLASALPSQLIDLGSGGPRFTRTVGALSGGSFKIAFAEPGAPTPAREVFDAVAKGRVEAGWGIAAYWSDRIPASTIFSGIPFGPEAPELLAWLRFGGGQAIYDEIYAAHGVKAIPCAVAASEASGWFRKEVTAAKDLKGLRVRIFGLGAKVLARLGAVPVLPEGDVFTAFESGAIDAAEYSVPAVDAKLEFERVARNYYFPGWHQPTTVVELLVNVGKWRALSPQHQAQIEAACSETIQHTMAESEALQSAAVAEIKGRGVAIRRWSPAMLDLFRKETEAVLAEEAARDANFRRALQSQAAFRASYTSWRRLGSI